MFTLAEAGSKPHSGASSVGRCEMGDDEASRGNTNEIDEEREARLLNIVSWHLLPIHFTLAMCCYIDRTNLSFAALQMNDDLSFGPAEYGMGAAIFFISYTSEQARFPRIPGTLLLSVLSMLPQR